MIGTTTGGAFNTKTPEGSMELFKELAMNSYQWYSFKTKLGKIAHVYNVDTIIALAVQMENLNKKIDGLMITKQ